MKIPSIRHPESEELLRYMDGEAPGARGQPDSLSSRKVLGVPRGARGAAEHGRRMCTLPEEYSRRDIFLLLQRRGPISIGDSRKLTPRSIGRASGIVCRRSCRRRCCTRNAGRRWPWPCS